MVLNQKQGSSPIVVGVDFSAVSHLAVCTAFRLATQQGRTEVHVLHADPALQPGVVGSLDEETESALQRLRRFVAGELEVLRTGRTEVGPHPLGPVVSHVSSRRPCEAISRLAADLSAELVIVGAHGRTGFSQLLLGSVAHAVVSLAPCPVLVVRPLVKAPFPSAEPEWGQTDDGSEVSVVGLAPTSTEPVTNPHQEVTDSGTLLSVNEPGQHRSSATR